MVFHDTYWDAFDACIETHTFSGAYLSRLNQVNMNIDAQNCCKIFFCLSGEKRFHINDQIYQVSPGDVFLIAEDDWHYFSGFNENTSHLRYVFFISPDFLKLHSTPTVDLNSCFAATKVRQSHRLPLQPGDWEALMAQIRRFSGGSEFGQAILDECCFMELLVRICRIANSKEAEMISSDLDWKSHPQQVRSMLAYVSSHVAEDLSAAAVAKQFFVSESRVRMLFKTHTGLPFHRYVTAQRILVAKRVLTNGASVSDACALSGFRDYSHFIKSFKKAVGIPPKKYVSQLQKMQAAE